MIGPFHGQTGGILQAVMIKLEQDIITRLIGSSIFVSANRPNSHNFPKSIVRGPILYPFRSLVLIPDLTRFIIQQAL